MEPMNRIRQLPMESQQQSSSNSNSQLPELDEKISSLISPATLIPRDTIIIGNVLGKGGFGTVYEGTWSFRKVAVKCYEGSQLPDRILQDIRHEVSMMLQLDHECLVRLFGLVEEKNRPPMLVMEQGTNGSLYTFLHSESEISWRHRLQLAEELARGLAYLHSKEIVHRDIKSFNVVLDRDYHAKWCDFGLAQLKQHSSLTSNADATQGGSGSAGTLHWMAPELFSRKSSSPRKQSDIWALGMLFYELVSGKIPYIDAQTPQQVMNWIMSGEGEEVPAECLEQFPCFASIMRKCWANLDDRPTAADIAAEIDVIAKQIGIGLKEAASENLTSSGEFPSLSSAGYARFSVKSTPVLEQNRQPIQLQKLAQPLSEEILPDFIDYTYKDSTSGLEATRRIECNRDSGAIPDMKTKNTWLHIASMIGHTTMLKAFIALDPQINLEQRNEEDMTPLMIAFQEQKEKSIEILLDAGADIYALSAKHGSALHLAARTNIRIFEIVLRKIGTSLNLDLEDSEGCTPLMASIRAKQTDVTIKLIDCGADIHKFSKDRLSYPLSTASSCGDKQTLKYLVERGAKVYPCRFKVNAFISLKNATPLFLAVCNKLTDREMIELLISAGDNPHGLLSNNTNLIYWAATYLNSEAFEYLLRDLRVNPNVKNSMDGETPLSRVWLDNDIQKLKLLLRYGATPNVMNNERETPLYDECSGHCADSSERIKLLLNAGADPNVACKNSETPFYRFVHYAFRSAVIPSRLGDLYGTPLLQDVYGVTQLFLNKGGKISSKMAQIMRASPLLDNNHDLKKLIDDNTNTGCTIM